MKKRLVKNGLVTTIVGLGVLIFSGILIWTGKATIEQTSGWMALGVMFLRSKDSIIGLGEREF